MNKVIFYKYDFYVLERMYTERKFIEILEGNSYLNELIKPFIINVVDSLYVSIKEDKSVETTEIVLPNIDEELKNVLAANQLYNSYITHSENSLSEFVFNKFLSRIFKKDGFNNEIHVIQDYIHSWLEKKNSFEHSSRFTF